MKIYNTTTQQMDELPEAIDAKTGMSWTGDLIYSDDQIRRNDELDRLETDQDNINWWAEVITELNASDRATRELLDSIADPYLQMEIARRIQAAADDANGDLEVEPQRVFEAIEEIKGELNAAK